MKGPLGADSDGFRVGPYLRLLAARILLRGFRVWVLPLVVGMQGVCMEFAASTLHAKYRSHGMYVREIPGLFVASEGCDPATYGEHPPGS